MGVQSYWHDSYMFTICRLCFQLSEAIFLLRGLELSRYPPNDAIDEEIKNKVSR